MNRVDWVGNLLNSRPLPSYNLTPRFGLFQMIMLGSRYTGYGLVPGCATTCLVRFVFLVTVFFPVTYLHVGYTSGFGYLRAIFFWKLPDSSIIGMSQLPSYGFTSRLAGVIMLSSLVCYTVSFCTPITQL